MHCSSGHTPRIPRCWSQATDARIYACENLFSCREEDVPEPIANMVRKFYGDPTRMKATKADDWDRKYHKALLKEQEPIWVASGVSVELQKFLAQLDKGGKYALPAGGALELACGVGIDSAAIAQSATFSQRKVHGVDISENAVAAATARYVHTTSKKMPMRPYQQGNETGTEQPMDLQAYRCRANFDVQQ